MLKVDNEKLRTEKELIELKYKKLLQRIFQDVFGARPGDQSEQSILNRSVKFELEEPPNLEGSRRQQRLKAHLELNLEHKVFKKTVPLH